MLVFYSIFSKSVFHAYFYSVFYNRRVSCLFFIHFF